MDTYSTLSYAEARGAETFFQLNEFERSTFNKKNPLGGCPLDINTQTRKDPRYKNAWSVPGSFYNNMNYYQL
jgi:hypothetical protein